MKLPREKKEVHWNLFSKVLQECRKIFRKIWGRANTKAACRTTHSLISNLALYLCLVPFLVCFLGVPSPWHIHTSLRGSPDSECQMTFGSSAHFHVAVWWLSFQISSQRDLIRPDSVLQSRHYQQKFWTVYKETTILWGLSPSHQFSFKMWM